MRRVKHARLKKALIALGLLLVWTLLVCYPDPRVFFRNFGRLHHFPVDPSVAARVGVPLPSTGRALEALVVNRLVRYDYDWRLYRVPWYFPTPAEVVRAQRGDCESRAVLLASLLAAKRIPFTVKASFTHMWIDYPGKPKTAIESDALRYLWRDKRGLHFHWPEQVRWLEFLRVQKQGLWEVAPVQRKVLLVLGWVGVPLVVFASLRRWS
jgi:hypothetical protein